MKINVVIDYTNYKGERSEREVQPMSIFFGRNKWHKEPQWLLRAFDISKLELREFAMKDIHSWRSA